MNLWLDDIRDPALHGPMLYRTDDFHWAHTAAEAIALLKSGWVTFASLDHDLGIDVPTGYDVVCFMEEHNIWPLDGVAVHSANPVGKQRMEQVISRYYRTAEQTLWNPTKFLNPLPPIRT